MQNGIPWWYFHKHGGEFEGRPVAAADPDGSIARLIDADRVIGSVVYPAATLDCTRRRPGRRRQDASRSVSSTDRTSPRVQAISGALNKAGFKAPVTSDIRGEIWLKIWGNLSFNPISALTHATLVDLLQFPLTRELSIAMMREAEAIANKLGDHAFASASTSASRARRRWARTRRRCCRTSRRAKPIELDALVGAVVELGRLTDTPTPHIDAVYALREPAREDARGPERQPTDRNSTAT